jgi:hypothetical protein
VSLVTVPFFVLKSSLLSPLQLPVCNNRRRILCQEIHK